MVSRSSNRIPLAVSIAALVIAMVGFTGVGEAARELLLPRHSVGTPQLERGAVTSAKVRDGSLRRRDLRPGTLLRGAGGKPGPKGDPGADGATGPRGPAGADGAGPAGVGVAALFGDGGDGDATISASATLSRDTYYGDLTIGPGTTLDPGGYRIFVRGTLTLDDGSAIARDGVDSPAVGAGLAPATLGGSGAGGDVSAGESTVNSLGGSGGEFTGWPRGFASPPAPEAGGAQIFESALAAITGRTLDGELVTGGAGGGSAGSYPPGASGGGVVVVAARHVEVQGQASITANGGRGLADIQVGGSGGGGVVAVITTSPKPAGLTLSAAGGRTRVAEHLAAGEPGRTVWLD